MSRLYVGLASSNLKSGASTALGYRTLIVGPNGSGKSTIQNTVELVLTGRVSDVAGRVDVGEANLVGLLAQDGKNITARVELSDERIITYEATRKASGGWNRADVDSDRPSVAFPVQLVRDNLTGSADKARRFLLANIGNAVTRDDVLRYLPADLHEGYNLRANGVSGNEIDRLLSVLESAKSRARSAKQEADAAEATKARMSEGLLPEPTDADLIAAEQEEARLVSLAAPTDARSNTTKADYEAVIATLVIEVKRLAARREETVAARDGHEAALAKLGAAPSNPIFPHLHKVATAAAEFPLCIVCGSVWTDEMRAEASDVVASIEGIADLHTLRTETTAKIANADAVIADIDGAINKAIEAMEEIEGRLAAAPETAPVAGATAEEIRAARDRVASLRQAKSGWQAVRGLRETVWNCQKIAAESKEIAEACDSAVKDLLNTALGAFTARVQAFLPAGDTFYLRIRDGEREVCQYGLLRDGAHHGALSGAEWARVTLALGCAIAPAADLVVFTPEERAFDPQTLRNVMVALSEAPGQVILTSPVRPSGRTPKGWTLVDLNPNSTPTETE